MASNPRVSGPALSLTSEDKRSPKAFERILWTRGMQLALGCDRAIVATTDGGAKIIRFAHQQKVALLTKDFLDRLRSKLDTSGRMTLEQFIDNIRTYKDHKQDGDWLRRVSDAKSALISMQRLPRLQQGGQRVSLLRGTGPNTTTPQRASAARRVSDGRTCLHRPRQRA